MTQKEIISPGQRRRLPEGFGWVDHRLVRDGHISRCSAEALALYLFLVTVADGQGLSYYSDQTVLRLLRLDGPALARARRELVAAALIAYQRPIYQVLALDGAPEKTSPPAGQGSTAGVKGQPVSLGQILRDMGREP